MTPALLQIVDEVEQPARGMLVVRIRGGLGNQMFQYAGALGLAASSGLNVGLDQHISYERDQFQRQFRLDSFRISAALLDRNTAADYARRHRAMRYRNRLSEFLVRRITGHNYLPGIHKRRVSSGYLEGYLQSPKYFEHCQETVRAEFRFAQSPHESSLRLLDEMAACESVALHVRRFVPPDRHYGVWGLKAAYYDQALSVIRRSVSGPRIYLFGDLPEWAIQNVAFREPVTVVRSSGFRPEVEDMRLMSACRHHIISNSTFGWWGAWLSNSGGHVCAPRDFSLDQRGGLRDVYPETWHVI